MSGLAQSSRKSPSGDWFAPLAGPDLESAFSPPTSALSPCRRHLFLFASANSRAVRKSCELTSD